MSSLRPTAMLLLALLAGVVVVPRAADAQCRLCDTPTTSHDQSPESTPIRLDVQARLDFDQLILLDANAPGTARLLPDGTSTTSGALAAMTGRAMVGNVIVHGEPGRLVRIGFPAEIQLYGLTGGTIRLSALTSDLPSAARLDSQGTLQFRFGGELAVSGNVDGEYRGDIPITVDYP